jgi:hypothetical protein
LYAGFDLVADLSFTGAVDLPAELVFFFVAGVAANLLLSGVAVLLAVVELCSVAGFAADLLAVVTDLLDVLKLVPSDCLF